VFTEGNRITCDILRIEDLVINFGTYDGTAYVVDDLNIHVGEREIIGLVGESGCGKTITAKAVIGILPKQAHVVGGKIIFKGTDLLRIEQKMLHEMRGKEIAWIPQDPMTSLNPVFTIEDQMMDILKWKGTYKLSPISYFRHKFENRSTANVKVEVIQMLERVQISDPERVMKSYPAQLSGGMRQRILIAMALLGNPSLIIADEPGTGLDVSVQAEILDLMQSKVKEDGNSVIFITHDLAVAKKICDRIYVMYAGAVVEIADKNELFADPKHPYTLGLLEAVPKLTGGVGKSIAGMIPNYYDPPSGCRFHPRCPYSMPICTTEKPLEYSVAGEHQVACYLFGDKRA